MTRYQVSEFGEIGQMHFYYRNLKDGRCEVICTRCFLTIGIASGIEAIRGLEDIHHCSKQEMPLFTGHSSPTAHHRGVPITSRLTRGNVPEHNASHARTTLRLIAVTFLFYVLPTVLEFEALRVWNPWIAIVLPGDLLGCVCLIAVFRKVKTGMAVYSLLTAMEGCLYSFHMTPLRAIPWIADLIPALMISGIMLRSPIRTTGHNSVS